MPENAPVPLNRTERVLAAMIVSVTGLSVLSIAVVMFAAGTGADMSGSIWSVIVLIGYIGLPIGFLLILTFLVVNTVRRRRVARDGDR